MEQRRYNGLQSVVRNLYTLIWNINRKRGTSAKKPDQLWPIGEKKKQFNALDIIRKWNAL